VDPLEILPFPLFALHGLTADLFGHLLQLTLQHRLTLANRHFAPLRFSRGIRNGENGTNFYHTICPLAIDKISRMAGFVTRLDETKPAGRDINTLGEIIVLPGRIRQGDFLYWENGATQRASCLRCVGNQGPTSDTNLRNKRHLYSGKSR